jgi:SAM-dependent methyltransferase
VTDLILQRETPSCALCGGDEFRVVMKGAKDWALYKPGAFDLARCASCDLVMTRPRPTPEALGLYYEGVYGRGRTFQVDSPIGRLIPWYRRVIIEKARPFTEDDRVLEIGASYGGFLKHLKDVRGCHVEAVDQEPNNAELGRAYGIDYHVGRFEDLELDEGAYDVVCLFECLEHIAEPLPALERCRALLKPGGSLVVEVPNYASVWRAVFRKTWMPLVLPQHLTHFTPKTLRKMVEAAGFDVDRQQAMFFPIEATASLLIWLRRLFRLPRIKERSGLQHLVGITSMFVGLACFLTIEIPTQLLFRALGRSGTQIVVGRATDAPKSEPGR